MINHRYRIINELGAGGSGKVFLVEDVLWNHAPRALKVLTHVTDAAPKENDPFLTETSILLSLHHPHLVTLYDFDVIRQDPSATLSGCPFILMEYVKGSDALAWSRTLGPGRNRAKGIRGLFAQALSVLAYVHAHGIIHSDIKPQNLLVAGDGTGRPSPVLKLTDFGFSRRAGASPDAPARGTLDYNAPEVLRGERVDQRIDLYSVGATFYHLVEGHCPFEAEDPVTLVKKILADEPLFSSPHWEDIPAVRSTVEALLKKNPADRPPTAHAALSILGERTLDLQDSGDGHQFVAPFVGRESELQHIRGVVRKEEASHGDAHPTAILLVGSEGMGKSRLVDEVVHLARVGGLRVFSASAVSGGIPYSSVRPLLRMLNLEVGSFAEFRGAPLPEGSRFIEKYLAVSTAAIESDDGYRARDRDATAEVLARYIIDCASLIPLMLVAENLDGMDENSVQVFQTVARDMPPGRAVIVASSAVDSVWSLSAPQLDQIPLPDLAVGDVVHLTQALLGEGQAMEKLGTRLYEVLGGMPIVVLEALRAIHDSVNAEYLGGNIETALELIDRVIPRDADQLLVNRFSKLAPEKRIVFAFLCCFVNPVPVALLERYLPFHPARIRSAVQSLDAAGLTAMTEGETRVSVRMARLKRIVYESLGPVRAPLHAMIAHAMSSSTVDLSIAELQEIAHHCAKMGEPGRASEYLEQAALRVLALQGHQLALDLFARAMEAAQALGDPDRVLSLQCQKVEALLQAGRTKEAIELGTSILTNSPPPDDCRRRLLRVVSVGRSRLGDFELAKEGFRQLLEGLEDASERAELKQELVNIEINLGGFKNAEETCHAQLEIAEELDRDELKGAILTDLGIATFLQGRYDDAARHFRYALGMYESLGDEAHVVSAITNVGNALNARGDSAAAIEQWRRALEYAVERGTLSQQAKIQNNLGIAYFNLGRHAEARASYLQSRETFQRLGMKGELTYTLTNLGEVMLADGDYGGAFATWTEALALYDMMADVRGLVETELQLAELHLILGVPSESERLLEEAHRYVEAEGVEPFRGAWKFWCGMVDANKGDHASALPLLREAHALFVSSGEDRKASRCLVAIAECLARSGEPQPAIEQLQSILVRPERETAPLLRAEVRYLLGFAERESPGSTEERPLTHFKKGMQLVEKEPIGEVTWKLTYALAREYFERGQRERARQNLVVTKKVLTHFVSSLPSEGLRSSYLAAEGRAQVLANIERHFRN